MNDVFYDGKGNLLGFAIDNDEYVKKDDVMNALIETSEINGYAFKMLDQKLEKLPTYKLNKWKKCANETPDNDRMVICRGERGACYMARFKDDYYWKRTMIRGGECDPVEWMDIPEINIEKIIQTKEIKYFDEDEKVWKIGRIIVEGDQND